MRRLPGASFLTVFAVNTRYPGHKASKHQAPAALRWAGRIRTTARELHSLAVARSQAESGNEGESADNQPADESAQEQNFLYTSRSRAIPSFIPCNSR